MTHGDGSSLQRLQETLHKQARHSFRKKAICKRSRGKTSCSVCRPGAFCVCTLSHTCGAQSFCRQTVVEDLDILRGVSQHFEELRIYFKGRLS